MPAAFAELVVKGGLPRFLCPISGKPVFGDKEGFTPGPGHSPFLRFFIEWIVDEVYVAAPGGLPEDQRELQQQLIAVCGDDSFDSQNEKVAALVALLPSSALVVEILDPPQGSYMGAICYVGFDFAGAAAEDIERAPVEMVSVGELA